MNQILHTYIWRINSHEIIATYFPVNAFVTYSKYYFDWPMCLHDA